MCEKKRRYIDRNSPGSHLGFRVYQKFYELTMPNRKTAKTVIEFINDKLYMRFVKFSRYLIDINPLNAEKFIEFLIRNSVPMNKWCLDEVYHKYLSQYCLSEDPLDAVERTIEFISNWSEKNDINYKYFFKYVGPFEATYLIQRGHLSPWVLFLSDTANDLFDNFNSEQAEMVTKVIDYKLWDTIFLNQKIDVLRTRKILEMAGL